MAIAKHAFEVPYFGGSGEQRFLLNHLGSWLLRLRLWQRLQPLQFHVGQRPAANLGAECQGAGPTPPENAYDVIDNDEIPTLPDNYVFSYNIILDWPEE